jgi:hypothetical protein
MLTSLTQLKTLTKLIAPLLLIKLITDNNAIETTIECKPVMWKERFRIEGKKKEKKLSIN